MQNLLKNIQWNGIMRWEGKKTADTLREIYYTYEMSALTSKYE